MQPSSIPQPVFLNVEFIFSWLWRHISWVFTLRFIAFVEFFATILIIGAICVILYSLVRLYEMKGEDKQKVSTEGQVRSEASAPSDTAVRLPGEEGAQPLARNETWENIRSKLLSDSPSDWRLAIIEADIYLDRLLDLRGYGGDTLGDKLKNMTPDRLASLQIAWEAHKVRNKIAHEGATFTLTMPEARRVLSYYEIVFRDLGVIE